ncbi:CALCIUM-BINDING PROTEIN CML48-RELATED [Salix purpurea]|uniref:CALCIUM-BINDING PROTEIN CML48-RELATED n=1 Tax=Salix purpurea TaxID=77065 RepID=A0A9Q0W3N2_SALPP|nr:CALCIUM-BINDING PROTEIN CML48-RELATED [Salix purpurea]
MSFFSRKKRSSSSHAPSAPSLPESYDQRGQTYSTSHQSNYSQQQQQPYYGQGNGGVSSYGYSGFPPGTSPDIIRSFEMVDRDRSGFIDENELQQAISSGYQRFNIRTVRLLMFLFKYPNDSLRCGPKEFAALWSCLGQWRGIFERYDKDRSGKIDLFELRDALYSLGFAIPSSVLQVLISKYDDGSGRRVELNFDSFVECGMMLKGLTEKFKEKDRRHTGTTAFNYDEFMSTIIPFLVSYD